MFGPGLYLGGRTVPKRKTAQEREREREVDALEAAWNEFESGFRRNRKGNLWREWEGWILTVFRRRNGRYGWCIASEERGTDYSPETYDTEDEALAALADMYAGR
jgi:hypothetical protein